MIIKFILLFIAGVILERLWTRRYRRAIKILKTVSDLTVAGLNIQQRTIDQLSAILYEMNPERFLSAKVTNTNDAVEYIDMKYVTMYDGFRETLRKQIAEADQQTKEI